MRSDPHRKTSRRRQIMKPTMMMTCTIVPLLLVLLHLQLITASAVEQQQPLQPAEETEDEETFVHRVLDQAQAEAEKAAQEEEAERQRKLQFFGSSGNNINNKETRFEGERCTTDEECVGQLECNHPHGSPQGQGSDGRCMVNKECMQHEFNIMGKAFDPLAYKRALFEEANVTEQDIWVARQTHPKNHTAFASNPKVVALLETIHNHQYELSQIAQIITECGGNGNGNGNRGGNGDIPQPRSGGNPADGQQQNWLQGAGSWVGSLFANAFGGILPESTTPAPSLAPTLSASPSTSPSVSSSPSASPSVAPSMTPSVSVQPSSVPSSAPTLLLTSTTYLGFHMEGGLLLDGSYTLYQWSQDDPSIRRLYGRGCLGFEAGAGSEIGIAVLVTQNRGINDLVGGSLLLDIDIALGAALGLGGGLFVSGDTTIERPLFYEVTIGTGLGAGLIGFSVCRTLRLE